MHEHWIVTLPRNLFTNPRESVRVAIMGISVFVVKTKLLPVRISMLATHCIIQMFSPKIMFNAFLGLSIIIPVLNPYYSRGVREYVCIFRLASFRIQNVNKFRLSRYFLLVRYQNRIRFSFPSCFHMIHPYAHEQMWMRERERKMGNKSPGKTHLHNDFDLPGQARAGLLSETKVSLSLSLCFPYIIKWDEMSYELIYATKNEEGARKKKDVSKNFLQVSIKPEFRPPMENMTTTFLFQSFGRMKEGERGLTGSLWLRRPRK